MKGSRLARRAGLVAVIVLFGAACGPGDVAPPDPVPTSTTTVVAPSVPPTTLATTTTTTTTTTAQATTTVAVSEAAQLRVVTRSDWGAADVSGELVVHDVDKITLHHTAGSHDDDTPDHRLRHSQEFHQSVGFADIAYHIIIGSDGTIFEGRDFGAVGDTRTSYDPTGHFLISLDGMFDEFWDGSDAGSAPDGADELSDVQREALVDVLAWASMEFDIEPAEIAGHRDYAATACPGSVIYAMLTSGELVEMVRDRIDRGAIELAFSDA
jgi:hypothetical protein